MSGIVGIVNLDGAPVDRKLLRRMTDFMAYRGPDAQEIWSDGPVGFGHAMLRTTWEAETERQPLSFDGDVWLTADARIDARADLIAKLEAKGRAGAKLANDAELILHAYHAWGDDCVNHLIGDFAFAIWDGRERRVFCARDHFGVKPFYYAQRRHFFVFSNTLTCVRLHPSVPDDLNDLAIADFLLFGVNRDASTTAFEGISRLPAAGALTLSATEARRSRYWALPADFHLHYTHRQASDVVEGFKQVLSEAVKDRLRADRVAISMSGGLDSTTVAASARGLAPGGALRAYTVSYARLIPDRERHYADLAAQTLAIPVDHLVADDLPLFEEEAVRKNLWPQPTDVAPLSAVSREFHGRMAAHGRVFLTGRDGDTFMAESPKHYHGFLLRRRRLGTLAGAASWYVRSQHRLPPVGLRTTLKRLLGTYPARSLYPSWLDPSFEARLRLWNRWTEVNSEAPRPHPTRPGAFKVVSSPNWAYLFEGYDPGVTGFPVEARHPIADIRVVEYLLRLPPVPWCVNKEILRVGMRGDLPLEILNRPKSALAGDPALVKVRNGAAGPIDSFQPRPELSRYVRRAAIPRIGRSASSDELWMNLRPLCLNLWLEAQRVAACSPRGAKV